MGVNSFQSAIVLFPPNWSGNSRLRFQNKIINVIMSDKTSAILLNVVGFIMFL